MWKGNKPQTDSERIDAINLGENEDEKKEKNVVPEAYENLFG